MGASGDGKHHIIPFAVYVNVLLALLVLTVVTVAVAQVDFGSLNTVIAMAIASMKAALVLAYFMHLKYDDKLFVVIFLTSVFFLILLFFFTWADFYTRFAQEGIL